MHKHPTLAHHLRKHFHGGGVVAFSSFVHGSGRSTVAKAIYGILSQEDGDVVRISTGEIFREMSQEMGFQDINRFVDFLSSHPDQMIQVESRVDATVYDLIRRYVREGKIVVIDSNLHAHPHALKDVPSVHFYVYASPKTIGKRLTKGQREGERRYSDSQEALEAQVKRTIKDADRYAILKHRSPHEHLKPLYTRGEKVIRRLLRNYLKERRVDALRRALLRATTGEGIFLNNDGPLEETVAQAREAITSNQW